MANKPTIYGFDDAGCKWGTVHKEDVPNIKFINATSNMEGDSASHKVTLTLSSDEFNNLKAGDLFIIPVDSTYRDEHAYNRMFTLKSLGVSSKAMFLVNSGEFDGSKWDYSFFSFSFNTNNNFDIFLNDSKTLTIKGCIIGVVI